MPADITGTEIIEEIALPVIARCTIRDRCSPTSCWLTAPHPPKTQAALLEAMQEAEDGAGGVTICRAILCPGYPDPIEMEGTYPLPEAQLDRFMFKIGYLSEEEESQW
jgi:MoxR-like ATPase